MRTCITHTSGTCAVRNLNAVPLRVVVEQFARVDRYIVAELLALVVENKNQLIGDYALHAVNSNQKPVNIRVVNLSTERPACSIRSSGQSAEEIASSSHRLLL